MSTVHDASLSLYCDASDTGYKSCEGWQLRQSWQSRVYRAHKEARGELTSSVCLFPSSPGREFSIPQARTFPRFAILLFWLSCWLWCVEVEVRNKLVLVDEVGGVCGGVTVAIELLATTTSEVARSLWSAMECALLRAGWHVRSYIVRVKLPRNTS